MTTTRVKLTDLIQQAKQRLASGDAPGAARLCLHILDYYPGTLEATRLLARAYVQLGKLSEADQLFEYSLEIEPRDGLSYGTRGFIASRQNRPEKAIIWYERAIELSPRLVYVKAELSRLYDVLNLSQTERTRRQQTIIGAANRSLLAGNYDRAIEEFGLVQGKAAERPDVREGLLEAYWRKFYYDKAETLGQSLLQSYPKLVQANLILWYIYRQRKEIETQEQSANYLLWANLYDPRNSLAKRLFDNLPLIDPAIDYILKNDLAVIPPFEGQLPPLKTAPPKAKLAEAEAISKAQAANKKLDKEIHEEAKAPAKPDWADLLPKTKLLPAASLKIAGLLPEPQIAIKLPAFTQISQVFSQNALNLTELVATSSETSSTTVAEPLLVQSETQPEATTMNNTDINVTEEQTSSVQVDQTIVLPELDTPVTEPELVSVAAQIEPVVGANLQIVNPLKLKATILIAPLDLPSAEAGVAEAAEQGQAVEPERAEAPSLIGRELTRTNRPSVLRRDLPKSAPMLNRHVFHKRDERGTVPARLAALILAQEEKERENKLTVAASAALEAAQSNSSAAVLTENNPQIRLIPAKSNRLVVALLALLVAAVLGLNLMLYLGQQNLGQELAASRREVVAQNGALGTALADIKTGASSDLERRLLELDKVQKQLDSQQQNIGKLLQAANDNKGAPVAAAGANLSKDSLQIIYQNLSLLNNTTLSVLQAHSGYQITGGGIVTNETPSPAMLLNEQGPGVVGAVSGLDAQKLAILAYAPRGWPVQGPISSPFGPRGKLFGFGAGPTAPTGQGRGGANLNYQAQTKAVANDTEAAATATNTTAPATATVSFTPSSTPLPTATNTATVTANVAATATAVCQQALTATPTATAPPPTPTCVPTSTPAPTNTVAPTNTATVAYSATPTFTPTPDYAATFTAQPTATITPLPTDTPTVTATFTFVPTATRTNPPKSTSTSTNSATPSASPTETTTPTNTATATVTPTATGTPYTAGPTSDVSFPNATSQIAPNGTQIIQVATLPSSPNPNPAGNPVQAAVGAIPTYYPARIPLVNPGVPLTSLGVNGNSLAVGPGQEFHTGIDIAVPEGTEVRATARGVVEYAGDQRNGYGIVVYINHPGGFITLYGHNSRLLVVPGQEVQAGQVIALSGNTGYSTGPHVHYEIRYQNRVIDPLPFMP